VINTGAIILSRYDSTRLPGKALRTINDKTVLEYIIERVAVILPADKIVIATSSLSSDDPIADFAVANKIKLYRGSKQNVAERFYQAAEQNSFDYAIRINGDNIFLDVNVLEKAIQLADSNQFDFITNVKERTFPKGMSVECVRKTYYEKLLPVISENPDFAEHVTLYFYNHDTEGKHKYIFNDKYPKAAGIQLALDTHDDFARTQKIINAFKKPHYHYNLGEIIKILNDINEEL
jgi:spore coat polysaccharide biosynthesis protein SpsF